ncbi:MAG: hypothetical protein KC668_01610 [Myxococcales bacterium]|nr:hypothetical protein [Myxococcales bacterium]
MHPDHIPSARTADEALPQAPSPHRAQPSDPSPAEALLRRWLVEYNPLYLASATCVLAGIWILARESARRPTVFGALSVWLLGEVYAMALIGGAAFLMRIRQGRAATMLAIMAAVFQVDPTMHLETSTYLGALGMVTTGAWLAVCAAKLYGLCWALDVRPSRSARALMALGALGLAVIPHALPVTGPTSRSTLICGWLFAVFGAALATRREVFGRAEWDPRAQRAVHATWALWGALLLAHAGYWATDLHVNLLPLFPAAAALTLPVWRQEQQVWAASALAIALAYVFTPAQFGFALALLTAAILVAAARGLVTAEPSAGPRGFEHPYRGSARLNGAATPRVPNESTRARLVLGALLLAYVALCAPDLTVTSEYAQPLTLLFPYAIVSCAIAALYRRVWFALPCAPLAAQAALERGWIPRPESAFAWGLLSTTTGFALLAVGLCASWWVTARERAEPCECALETAPPPRRTDGATRASPG